MRPLFLALVLLAGLSQRLGAAPPHLLIFLADDLSARDVGAYGSTDVRTPAIDQLAREGLTFDRAFIVSPACAPSRAALLTGLTPCHNGAKANHTYKRDEVASLPARFAALGYQTAAFGKIAHGNSDALRHGFDHVDPSLDPEHIATWLAARDPARPVALFVGTHAPHVPWPQVEGYDPATVTIPPFHIDTPDTRLFRARYYTDVTRADSDFAATRQLVEATLGATDLITVFSSDHGAQWPFGKWNLYDEGIRVPLVIRWPGHLAAGARTAAMVSWLDLLPTLLVTVGDTLPPGLDGRPFTAAWSAPATATHRDHLFTTHDHDGRANVYPLRSVRTERWKYIRNLHPDWIHSTHSDRFRKADAGAYFWSWEAAATHDPTAALLLNRYRQRPGEELYDLAADPDELNNLAADSRYASTLTTMRTELDAWMQDQGDDGQVPVAPWLAGDPALLDPQSPWPPYRP